MPKDEAFVYVCTFVMGILFSLSLGDSYIMVWLEEISGVGKPSGCFAGGGGIYSQELCEFSEPFKLKWLSVLLH